MTQGALRVPRLQRRVICPVCEGRSGGKPIRSFGMFGLGRVWAGCLAIAIGNAPTLYRPGMPCVHTPCFANVRLQNSCSQLTKGWISSRIFWCPVYVLYRPGPLFEGLQLSNCQLSTGATGSRGQTYIVVCYSVALKNVFIQGSIQFHSSNTRLPDKFSNMGSAENVTWLQKLSEQCKGTLQNISNVTKPNKCSKHRCRLDGPGIHPEHAHCSP